MVAQLPWPAHQFVDYWGRAESWRSLPLPQRLKLLRLAASIHDAASLEAALAHSGVSLLHEAVASAAAVGAILAPEVLLRREAGSLNPTTLYVACAQGQLDALRWLASSSDFLGAAMRHPLHLGHAAQEACHGGHAAVLSWLRQELSHNPGVDDLVQLAACAARNGHAALMQEL